MARETSKCQPMREARGDFDNYLTGNGIDIGCGPDMLKIKLGHVIGWDKPQGDASYLAGVADGSLDFVYSSHCLEHLVDLNIALTHWSRVLKPGGHAYILIPDYLYYEKCRWPSVFNTDHKHSFSLEIGRDKVKRNNHWNIYTDLEPVMNKVGLQLIKATLELDGYDWNNGHVDQTMKGAVSQLCLIARKS